MEVTEVLQQLQLAPTLLAGLVSGRDTVLVRILFPILSSYLLSNFPGASCKDENDCSGHLVCKSGKCASD
jgi:hypothetical protein